MRIYLDPLWETRPKRSEMTFSMRRDPTAVHHSQILLPKWSHIAKWETKKCSAPARLCIEWLRVPDKRLETSTETNQCQVSAIKDPKLLTNSHKHPCLFKIWRVFRERSLSVACSTNTGSEMLMSILMLSDLLVEPSHLMSPKLGSPMHLLVKLRRVTTMLGRLMVASLRSPRLLPSRFTEPREVLTATSSKWERTKTTKIVSNRWLMSVTTHLMRTCIWVASADQALTTSPLALTRPPTSWARAQTNLTILIVSLSI